MMVWIRNFTLFAAGAVFGAWLMQTGLAQTQAPGLRLNHVGIYAKNFEESMQFYTQTMGFKEAFTIRDASGNPTLAYLHITRDTFLEIAPSTAERPAGLSHIGLWPQDLNATVAALRARGVQIADPRTGATRTSITNVTDPNGHRLEFVDFLADSAPAKAMQSFR